MDPAGVLLALEEQKKWRARGKRIEERIRQIDRRKRYLERELEKVRKKVSEFGALLAGLSEKYLPADRVVQPPAIR